jgi:hypothetical protein
MSDVTQLPNPINLRAGLDAVRERVKSTGASPEAARRARLTFLHELQEGRSTAASVAVANGTLREQALPHRGYPTPPSAA